MGGLPS
jgi:hypothetical protein